MAKTAYAERLGKLMERAGIETLQEFVERLNEGAETPFPYATVRRYHQDREPSIPYLVRVAGVFGARLDWLITGTEPVFEDSLSSTAGFGQFKEALAVRDSVLRGMGVTTVMSYRYLPSWVAPTMDACTHLGLDAKTIGEALEGLLKALNAHPSDDSGYILSMMPILLSLEPKEG